MFKSEARILKKIESRCSSKEESTTEEKVNVVSELRIIYPLMILLKVSGLAKSVYYYTLSKENKDEKNNKIIDELILAIDDYINYYNYDRIKVKLKGLSPVNYRLQSFN